MTAFVLDRLGAARVVATCQYDLNRFRLAREALAASRVEYLPQTQLEDMLGHMGGAVFDLVVVSAALHHLTSPQEGLFVARRLLRRNGLFLLEAAVLPGDEPALYLNSELTDPVIGSPTVWLPTIRALEGMLKLASFVPLSRIRSGGR